MKSKVTNSNSQIINYAKGHYVESDTFYDLAIIIAEYYIMDVECVTLSDIASILKTSCYEFGLVSNTRQFETFIDKISPSNYYYWVGGIKYMNRPHPDYDFHKSVIYTCLSFLRQIKVRKKQLDGSYTWIVEIEDADPTLIPLYVKNN